LISRSYNRILRTALRARFSDAQCGFKAVRADALPLLLGAVRDDGWFFDTELLVAAQRRGMRIHEVPVDWVEDADSRVKIVSTALHDLRGIVRLIAAMPFVRFTAIGIASTLAYAALFLILAGPLGSFAASTVALTLTAVANTAANRRLTFGVRGRAELGRHHAAGLALFVVALALTDGALAVLHRFDHDPARTLEALVLIVASLCATVTRYVTLRNWVFAGSRRTRDATATISSRLEEAR
jgi:putative flippase GtrA